MEESKCEHPNFIESENFYLCPDCKEWAFKYLPFDTQGIWVDGYEPPEIRKQRSFEKAKNKRKFGITR